MDCDNREFNNSLINAGVWKRIAILENAVFGTENPGKEYDGQIAGKIAYEVIGKCIKEALEEFEKRIQILEEKQKKWQSAEENLEDSQKIIERVQEQLQEKQEECLEKATKIEWLNQKIEELNQNKKEQEDLYKKKEKELEKVLYDLNTVHEELIQGKDIEIESWKWKLEYFYEEVKIVAELELEEEYDILLENIKWEDEGMGKKISKEEFKKKLEIKLKDKIKAKFKQKLKEKIDEKQKECDRILENEKKVWKEQKQQLEKELSNMTTHYNNACRENEDLRQDKQNLTTKLENTNVALEEEKEKVQKYCDKFGIWDGDTREYQKILEALLECDSLSDMLEDYGIEKTKGSENVRNIIRFISLFGSEASGFLRTLYEYLEDDRKGEQKFLNTEEIQLIKILNQYYKQQEELGITFDIIRYPEVGDKFDKSMMVDMEYRNKIYRTVEGVYVPTIMRDEKNPLLLALVKGV